VAGDAKPLIEAEAPRFPGETSAPEAVSHQFDGERLPIDFQWLRTPYPERLFSLTERPGWLRLHGRETIGSLFEQALVARRQQAFRYTAETLVEFDPAHYQQAAGLVCYYGSTKFHYLHITTDEERGRHLQVMSALPDQPQSDAFSQPVPIPAGPIELRVDVDLDVLRFAYRMAGEEAWRAVPGTFDASILSDEASPPGMPNFTGAFVGGACQDMSGMAHPADFRYFRYEERG